jgi:tripartite-type tricarboxylate transporter receptor subunit TctC
MKFPHRRHVLHLAAGAAALPAVSRVARAQAYPTRPIRAIVGYPAGGGTDIFIRLLGQPLNEKLGQPFVIENRAGAAGNIATEAVVRAQPDGYTLLGFDAAAAINATLYDKLNFNFVRDIAVVGMIRGPLVVLVHPSVPAKTFPEFIAYAKANPAKINMASAGNGNPTHLAGELLKAVAKIDMTHVPYRGAAQFELRDSRATFAAYVPVGSVAKGETLAKTGGSERRRPNSADRRTLTNLHRAATL